MAIPERAYCGFDVGAATVGRPYGVTPPYWCWDWR